MRDHIGRHILYGAVEDDDPNICGFCGRNICQKLNVSTVTHKKASYKQQFLIFTGKNIHKQCF